MPIFDMHNTRQNPIWKTYNHLNRAEPGDTTKEPGFYAGSRYVGGKEGAWGNSDFLYTTLGENNQKYLKNAADYWWYEPAYTTVADAPRSAHPVFPDFHYY